jgi:FkbM family methyltransferase
MAGIVTSILGRFKRGLKRGPLRTLLKRWGVVDLGKQVYNRALRSHGVHERTLLGQPLKFIVETDREIARIDAPFNEEPFVRRLLDAVRAGDVVYDIGANIGVVTMLVATAKSAGGVRVHAFEPEPRNAEHLEQNILLNGLRNVRIHRCALGKRNGTITLFVDGQTGEGTHSIMEDHRDGRATLEVVLRRGVDAAEHIGNPPDVLKIDVEGAEWEVLSGFEDLLRIGRVREILVEVHPESLRAAGTTPERLEQWLASFGYTLSWSRPRGHELHQHYRNDSARRSEESASPAPT